jgi:hypothetical protein
MAPSCQAELTRKGELVSSSKDRVKLLSVMKCVLLSCMGMCALD